jgi:hypothetical protein
MLISGLDVAKFDRSLLDEFAEEVVSDVHVLGVLMSAGVHGQSHCALVVDVKDGWWKQES